MRKVKKHSPDKAITVFIPYGEKDRFTIEARQKIKRSESTIAKALRMARGYKSIAAYLLRMNADSLSHRLAQSTYLQNVRDEAVEDFLFMSEVTVYDAIKNGDANLAFKVLTSLGSKYGWSPELEELKKQMGGPGLTINIHTDSEEYDELEQKVLTRKRVKHVVRTRIKLSQHDGGHKLITKNEEGQPVQRESVEEQVAELRQLQKDGYNRSTAKF